MFEGAMPALITPFKTRPEELPAIDFDALDTLVEWHLENGVSGFVVCGTTGESVTLDEEEKLALVKRVGDVVGGRVPIIVGTGTNSTKASIEMTKAVRALKVDGVLVVSPYYNKPTQEGLYRHFKAVAEEGGLPLIVYNVPSRTAVEVSVETFERLANVPNIAGVKQAVDSISKLLELSGRVGDKLDIFAGNCEITHTVMTMGGKGVISASANIIPKEMSEIVSRWVSGDRSGSLEMQRRALPVIKAVFAETNPIPLKAGLAMLGRIPSDAMRLPLVPASEKTRKKLASVLEMA